MIVLFGVAFSLGTLGLWLKVTQLTPLDFPYGVVFVSLGLLAMVLGGIWWGAVARPEISSIEPLLCATLFLGMVIILGLGHIVPKTPLSFEGVGLVWVVITTLLFFLGFFLWGAGPPFLTALAFPEERGTGQGLFSLAALAFFSVAVGIALSAFWDLATPLKNIWVTDLSALCIAGLILWIWVTRKESDGDINLRFWPTQSLGYFTEDNSYGKELLVEGRSLIPLKPAAFLGNLSAGGAIFLAIWDGTPLTPYFMNLWGSLFLVPLGLALGAFFIGPFLARLASPMAALGFNILLISLFLALTPDGDSLFLRWFRLGVPLLTAGSLWPLATRVGLCGGKGFFPFSFGEINLFLQLGFLIGFLLTFMCVHFEAKELFTEIFAYLALGGVFLAFGSRISWIFDGILTIGLGILYQFL
jgi:hypothetical protein